MSGRISIFVIISSVILSSCSPNGSDNPDLPTNPNGSSVETNPPNTVYAPSFSGQTRIARILTSTRYASRIITEQLQSPWGITSMPDGRLLITEKAGQLRIVTLNGQISNPILGLPQVNSSGQGGLLGIKIDPDSQSTG